MLDEAATIAQSASGPGSDRAETVDIVDTDTDVVEAAPARTSRASVLRVTALAMLPLALYVVLRPENYSLTPNSLDPVFYTGYSMNFDDVMNAVGDRHYFVTRWSLYGPMRVFDWLVGDAAGRLVWRWVLGAVIAFAIAGFAAARRWSFAQQLSLATVVLSLPMFVRAFMSDYMEYAVVGFGLVLVMVCLRERHTALTGAAVGTIGALMLVANPFSVFIVGFAVGAALVLTRGGVRARAVFCLAGAAAAGVVVLAGLVWFRWRYGIDNVYRPTITFMRTYQGDPDAWKSPRLDWLGRFMWLYGPLVVLAVAVALSWRRRVVWSRVELAALGLCGVQYAFQWFDQFARNSYGLEVSFYWSFMYPAFAAGLVTVLGRLTVGASRRALGLGTAGWLALLVVGVASPLHVPPGLLGGLVIVGMVAVAAVLGRRRPSLGAVALVVAVGWTQFAAPAYDPSAYFFLNISPHYDALYRRAGDTSETILHETLWFADRMDTVPNDASTSFVTAGGWSNSIVGIYAPHVTGRWIEPPPPGDEVTAQTLAEIRGGNRPIVAVYGLPDLVAPLVESVERGTGLGRIVLDETHDGGLGYRLVVLEMPDSARLPFTWTGDVLPLVSGTATADHSVRVEAPAPAGFVTYGPYRSLAVGRYAVELTYRSSVPSSENAGTFDVAPLGGTPVASIAVAGTAGAESSARLTFDVADASALWEFRTQWAGVGTFDVVAVTLTAVPPGSA